MARELHDEQREHFQHKSEDEGTQAPLDAGVSDPSDPADTRPGRAVVTDQPGEPTPTNLVGQGDFPPDGATSST